MEHAYVDFIILLSTFPSGKKVLCSQPFTHKEDTEILKFRKLLCPNNNTFSLFEH